VDPVERVRARFTVKAFDPNKEIVTVEQKGRTYQLALKESKIALLAVTPGQTSTTPGCHRTPLPGSLAAWGSSPGRSISAGRPRPVGTAPSLTPEQLRNLEADINRRRELRRQAAAAQSGGQPQQR